MLSTRLFVFALLLAVARCGTATADDGIPADPSLRWWKGNLHTHTLWSDGNDFPDMVAEWYATHGYNFLALSDHNVLSEGIRYMPAAAIAKRDATALDKYIQRFGNSWVETRGEGDALEVRLKPFGEYRALVEERGKFVMFPGEEISDSAEGVPVHMNATNIAELVLPLGGKTVREAIAANARAVEEQAKKTGREVMVHLNHPNFGFAITAEDLADVLSERFFEVYNGHPGVNQQGDKNRPSVDYLWDVANTIRVGQMQAAPLWGLATDDSHDYHGHPNSSRPGRGWTMVRATHLTPESIIRALKRGDMYASSGVTLADARFDAASGLLELSIEPNGDAIFTTQFIGTPKDYDPASEPRLNDKGEPIRATRKYSADVGKVFAEAEGPNPKYQLTGQELYVRAIITSSLPPADPSFPDQKAQAWTQPVGWEKWIQQKPAEPE
ncbi:MAG: PHP domain-containing protein [Pirellulales bacterium]